MNRFLKLFILTLTLVALTTLSVSAFSDTTDADATFLVEQGILKGYEDGTFRPDAPITRAEFSTVMCRALNLLDYADSVAGEQLFTDVPTTNWACKYVNALAKKGIINGVGDGKFDPDSTVTHAQVSKIIASALGYTAEDAAHYGGYPVGWQKLAEIVGFSFVETEADIEKPMNRISVVHAICQSSIVYKAPTVVATMEDVLRKDTNFLKTVEKLDIGMSTEQFPYDWHLLGFDNLKEITCHPDNPSYRVVDGVLYNHRLDELVKYPAAKPGKFFAIPAGVGNVLTGAFYNAKYLTQIDLGPDLRLINHDAFINCKFRSLTFPSNFSRILEDGFINCKYLEEVHILSDRFESPYNNVFEGAAEGLMIYIEKDTYQSAYNFATKYLYGYNGTYPDYMPDNVRKLYVGMPYAKAKEIAKEFGVYPTGTNGKWVVYGDYEKFTAIYYVDDVSTFIFTTDTSDVTGAWSPFPDSIGGIDWGIGKGTHPTMVPDESNEIMIAHFVNAFRAVHKLPPLAYDSALADISRYHSDNMYKANILDHNLNGETPANRLNKFRYHYTSYRENIAKGYYSSLLTVCGWIASEGHRANFLGTDITQMGVGISKEKQFYTWMGAKGSGPIPDEPEPEPEPVKPAKKDFDITKVVTAKTIPDGVYTIITKLDTDYALDIYNGSKENGANVQIWHRNNTTAQKFKVTNVGDGCYSIVNVNSGKAIDAQNGNTAAQTNVWQYSVNGTDAQVWRIIPSYEKTYRILNVASGLFLDVDLAKAADGTNVKLYYQNDDFEAQNWYFMPE